MIQFHGREVGSCWLNSAVRLRARNYSPMTRGNLGRFRSGGSRNLPGCNLSWCTRNYAFLGCIWQTLGEWRSRRWERIRHL